MAARVTGTATSRRRLLGGLVTLLACVGCGATGHGPAGAAARQAAGTRRDAGGGSASQSAAAFARFTAQPPPGTWHLARIPSGAVLPYPGSWALLRGDPGTATAALRTSHGAYVGYLNLTPRQGDETLSNWISFRIEHNREEGDRHVKELAAAASLRFRTGRGTCVQDSYVGSTGNAYVEIACLIAGSKTGVVAVGAAPPSAWPRQAAVIERAIEGVEA